jgi:hypothetical protein
MVACPHALGQNIMVSGTYGGGSSYLKVDRKQRGRI